MQQNGIFCFDESPDEHGRIVELDGGVYIPATQRADGTWRKERRCRPGYKPQDEVSAFECRGSEFRKRKAQFDEHPPGWGPEFDEPAKPKQLTKNQLKQKRRRERKREQKELGGEEKQAETPKLDEKTALEKELRKLKKLSRQILALERSESELTEEQAAKLSRKQEIEALILSAQAGLLKL